MLVDKSLFRNQVDGGQKRTSHFACFRDENSKDIKKRGWTVKINKQRKYNKDCVNKCGL